MNKEKLTRQEIEHIKKDFFSDIKNKSPKEIKKIKKLAASKRVSLKEEKNLFCRKCLSPYLGDEKIRVNRQKKMITCEKCGAVKIKNIRNNINKQKLSI